MIPLLVILEILILCLGATLFLYRPQMRVSEAICVGIIVALLTLSFVYQTVFLIGEPKLAFIVEGVLVIASLILLKRRSNYLKLIFTTILNFWKQHKIISTLVGIALIYLGLQAVLLSPTGPDFSTYHLPRVLLFQQENSLYLEDITTLRQAIFPVGWNILSHALLRFYTDYGLGIFAFLVYVAIGCGTYALARSITSQKIAILSTLIIISMPQVVLQSTSMNNDSPLAGIAVFCFLLLFRLYQKLNIREVVLLILGAAFGLSIKLTFLLFLAPFTVLGCLLLCQKYSLRDIVKLILSHWKLLIALIFPVVIFSQVWLYIHNYHHWGGWSGPPDYIDHFKQADGLKGSIANLMRFLFQSIDLMLPTDFISRLLWDTRLSDLLENLYNQLIYPLVGEAGLLKDSSNLPLPFKIQWRYSENYAWYGILGGGLALPSILYALFRGQKLIKVVGLTLLCFLLLVCYKVGWSPFRGRYFSLFFVSSGVCVAYTLKSLKQWLKNKFTFILKVIVVTYCICTLWLTLSMNEDKVILSSPSDQHFISQILNKNIWVKSQLGQRRKYKTISRQLEPLIQPDSQVALIAPVQQDIYNYLLALPNVKIIPIHSLSYPNIQLKRVSQPEFTDYQFSNPLMDKREDFDYLLCLNANCEIDGQGLLPNFPRHLIWPFRPSEAQVRTKIIPEAQLFKLH